MAKIINTGLKLELKLSDFDGPLDLLTTLIQEKKMNILNLDILELTNQYLDYIHSAANDINIEEASDYLLMASHLIEMKSKKILPNENDAINNFEFDYERDVLVKRLIEYQKYKDSIKVFLNKSQNRLELLSKSTNDLKDFLPKKREIEKLPNNVDPEKLFEAMQRAFDKWRLSIFVEHKIVVQEISIEDVENELISYLENHNFEKMSFSNYLKNVDEFKISTQYIVTCFVALLELVKNRKIILSQDFQNDEIYFQKNSEVKSVDEFDKDIKIGE